MFFNRPAPIYTGNRRTKVLRPGKRILEVVVESRKHSGGPLYLHSLTRYERCVDALLTTCAWKKKNSTLYIKFDLTLSFNAALPFFELQIDLLLSNARINVQSISPYGMLSTN